MNNIILENVSKKIKGRIILDNINLNLNSGKIYGFVGVNGSGKSMLFRAISGLIKIDNGKITVFGEEIGQDVSFPSNFGISIEEGGFWKNLTGFENLKQLSKIKNKITDETIYDTLYRVGLSPNDTRSYDKFSLGMKQRLSIAQAIMENPDLIILDEPTNALDDDGVNKIYSLIKEEKSRGATILIASHNREDLKLLCDNIFELYDGKIIKEY